MYNLKFKFEDRLFLPSAASGLLTSLHSLVYFISYSFAHYEYKLGDCCSLVSLVILLKVKTLPCFLPLQLSFHSTKGEILCAGSCWNRDVSFPAMVFLGPGITNYC